MNSMNSPVGRKKYNEHTIDKLSCPRLRQESYQPWWDSRKDRNCQFILLWARDERQSKKLLTLPYSGQQASNQACRSRSYLAQSCVLYDQRRILVQTQSGTQWSRQRNVSVERCMLALVAIRSGFWGMYRARLTSPSWLIRCVIWILGPVKVCEPSSMWYMSLSHRMD